MAPTAPYTTNSPSFSPETLFDTSHLSASTDPLATDDLRLAITTAFKLPPHDSYVYHAIASVTLSQVQSAVSAGSANGLQNWYLSPTNEPLGHPPPADIDAYISLFNPKSNSTNALKGFASNAKKGSLKAHVAAHLLSKRHLDERLTINKRKAPFLNPAFDFWAWSCRSLQWAGPTEGTARVKMAHAVLVVFMHHFGCVVPSYEAIEIIKQVASGKPVVDLGSGNGYWTLMLRRVGLDVTPVDSGQSEYRTVWVPDTSRTDGLVWLKRNDSGKGRVLLLVYPITEGGFSEKVLREYKGDAVIVAGTQNGNGYTGFKGEGVEEWMARERREFELTARVALPSFAGKDEALFVFQKK